MMLKRIRTTIWQSSDGKHWTSRDEAFRAEKIHRLAAMVYASATLSPSEAADLAQAIVDNKEGFVIALLPKKEGEQS